MAKEALVDDSHDHCLVYFWHVVDTYSEFCSRTIHLLALLSRFRKIAKLDPVLFLQ